MHTCFGCVAVVVVCGSVDVPGGSTAWYNGRRRYSLEAHQRADTM